MVTQDLLKVPAEIRAMRAAFKSLGLDELFPFVEAERSHDNLADDMYEWANNIEPGPDETLVIYSTGHGDSNFPYGLVVPGKAPFRPEEFLHRLSGRQQLRQIVMIVDACYAETAFEGVGRATTRMDSANIKKDFWTIAVSRCTEPAQQGVFVNEFSKWLRSNSSASWSVGHFQPGTIVGAIDLGAKQSAKLLADHGGKCLALPNPHHQRPEAPKPKDLPIDADWAAAARGVNTAQDPGFFFTGRSSAVSTLHRHFRTPGAGPTTMIVTGTQQSGKSAVLGHVLLQIATPELLPISQRIGGPNADFRTLAARGGRTAVVSQLLRNLGAVGNDIQEMVLALRAVDTPLVVVLDHLSETDDWKDVLAALTGTKGLKLVLGLPLQTSIEMVGAYVVNLDTDCPSDSDVRCFLMKRLSYSSPAVIGDEAQAHARLWGSSFSVAVSAITAWDSMPPNSEREERADRNAAEEAQRLCVEIMSSQFGSLTARTLTSALWGLCSFDPTTAISTGTWLEATGLSDDVVIDPVVLAEWAGRLRPHVTSALGRDGEPRWRPRPCFDASRGERARTSGLGNRRAYLDRLLEHIELDEVDFDSVDPGMAALLAIGVGLPGAHGRPIDRPKFLLNADPALIQHAVRRLADPGERGRLSEISGVLAKNAPQPDREMLLAIASRRFGQPSLSIGITGVNWVEVDRTRFARLTDLASCSGSVIVTVNSQEELEFTDVETGGPTRMPTRVLGVPAAVSAATVGGVDMALVRTVGGDLWLVPCRDGSRPRRLDLGLRADLAQLHPSGLILIGVASELWRTYVDRQSVERVTASEFTLRNLHLTGPFDRAICWTVSLNGKLRRLLASTTTAEDVALFPLQRAPRLTAVSPDGRRLLAVDPAGVLHQRSVEKHKDSLRGVVVRNVRAAALDERLAIIGSRSPTGSGNLLVHDFESGVTSMPITLDDEPIWLSLTPSQLLVARPSGLLSLARSSLPLEDEANR